MAAQWFALPKLFSLSKTNLLQIVMDEPGFIQWKYEQVCITFPLPKLTSQTYLKNLVMESKIHPQSRNPQRSCLSVPRTRHH